MPYAVPVVWKREVGRLSSSLSFEHTQGVSFISFCYSLTSSFI